MGTFLPSQPASYWTLIQRSFKLYRVSFSHIIILALLLACITFIPRILSIIIGQNVFLNLPPFSPHRLWLIILNLASLILFIAIIWRMHCVIRGFHEPFIEDFYVGMQKVLYVFIATIIQSLSVIAVVLIIFGLQVLLYEYRDFFAQHPIYIILFFILFICQFLLVLYISTLFIFLVPLIAIEKKGILNSIKRSVSMVWNHWWRVFSVQITPWIFYIILLMIMKKLLNINIHIYFTDYKAFSLGSTIINIIVFALFIPWTAALLLVQLKDLELRKGMAKQIPWIRTITMRRQKRLKS